MATDLRLWISADEPRMLPEGIRADKDTINGNGEWTEIAKYVDGVYLTFYWIRMEGDQYIVGSCWGSYFTEVDYLTTTGKYAGPISKVVAEAWPIYTRLTANGKAREFVEGALTDIKMDDGGIHRFVAILFPSPLITEIEDLYSGASGEAVYRLAELSRDLLAETWDGLESIPHMIKAFAREPRPSGVLSSTNFGFALDRIIEVLGMMARPGG